MMSLTVKQRDCLRFLKAYLAENGIAPTVREISTALNLESTHGVHKILVALEQRGHISRIPRCARAIEILHQDICPHCGHSSSAGLSPSTAGVGAGDESRPPAVVPGATKSREAA